MADWLYLPSGQAVNMDRVSHVLSIASTPEGQLLLYGPDQHEIRLSGADVDAMRAYLDRVHVGERPDAEKPPPGRDNFIRKT